MMRYECVGRDAIDDGFEEHARMTGDEVIVIFTYTGVQRLHLHAGSGDMVGRSVVPPEHDEHAFLNRIPPRDPNLPIMVVFKSVMCTAFRA